MLAVRIVISVIFLFFAFYFLLLAGNNKGKESATVTNVIIGTMLAILTYAMWHFPLG